MRRSDGPIFGHLLQPIARVTAYIETALDPAMRRLRKWRFRTHRSPTLSRRVRRVTAYACQTFNLIMPLSRGPTQSVVDAEAIMVG